jgi:hypothetical protein
MNTPAHKLQLAIRLAVCVLFFIVTAGLTQQPSPETGRSNPAIDSGNVRISSDKQSILYEHEGKSTTILTVAALPKKSSLEPELSIAARGFLAAVASPDKRRVAFSVEGDANDWIGILITHTTNVKEVDLIADGSASSVLAWSPQNLFLAAEITPASGLRSIDIIDTEKERLLISLPHLTNKDRPVEVYAPTWKNGSILSYKQKGISDGVEQSQLYDVLKRKSVGSLQDR